MLSFVLRFLKHHTKLVYLILFVGLVHASLLGTTGFIVGNQKGDEWSNLSLSFVLVVAFRFLVDLLQGFFSNKLFVSVKNNIFETLENNLSVLRTRFSNGEIQERVASDVPELVDNLILCSVEIVSSLITFIFICSAILILNPKNLFIGLSFGIVFLLGIFTIRKISKNIHLRIEESEEEIFRIEKNSIEGHDYLVTSGRKKELKDSYEKSLKDHFVNETKKIVFDNTTSGVVWAVRFGFIILLITPAFQKAGVSPIVAFWIYLLLNNLQQLALCLLRLFSVQPIFERNVPLLSAIRGKDRREKSQELEVHAKHLEIYFDTSYQVNGLSNLNFHWKLGDKVWIKGESGVGKTTLLKTIIGLHDFYKGDLIVPDNRKYKISYVEQDPFFFDGESLFYNLGINGQAELCPSLIKTLGLSSFFEAFGSDLNQKIGREGLLPSRGQKVRLALLRELLQKPDILLLDEPSSGLDEENTRSLFLLLEELSHNKIIIVCEHSLLVANLLSPSYILDLTGFGNISVKDSLSLRDEEK